MADESNQRISPSAIFSYGRKERIINTLIATGITLAVISFIITSILVARYTNIFPFTLVSAIITHIFSAIYSGSLLGAFYTTLVGGLFFLTMPMEILYANFLLKGHLWILVLTLYILGMIFSYTLNYYIGFKLSRFAKSIITPKKFYPLKGLLNKYGPIAIFFVNALPLPSQPLSVILGVFNYNKVRFYILFIAGQVVKFGFLTWFILIFA
ncbi:MAG: hypothetical protein ACMXYE_04455 [Candidatus Woesearchaeota archaeon]